MLPVCSQINSATLCANLVSLASTPLDEIFVFGGPKMSQKSALFSALQYRNEQRSRAAGKICFRTCAEENQYTNFRDVTHASLAKRVFLGLAVIGCLFVKHSSLGCGFLFLSISSRNFRQTATPTSCVGHCRSLDHKDIESPMRTNFNYTI
jgi:hypothetical protein